MPISDKFSSVFKQNWNINFLQCFVNNEIKYTDLCHLLQLTAHEHSVLGGLSFWDMQKFNQAWVLTNFYIEIDQLPKVNDVIEIKTWIVSMENSKSVRALEIWHQGVKIIGALTEWVVLNTEIRKVDAIALAFDHFEIYPYRLPTKNSLERVSALKSFDFEISQTVKNSDLDLVQHVNNIKYLEWCLDTLPQTFLIKNKITKIHINFLREMKCDQNFTIQKKRVTNKYCFMIITEKKCCLIELTFEDRNKSS